ncbi:MAG: ARMT1-like domain-containing protein [Desulfobulbaceae bacterium]|nr:ARMT1-like domain-containing protein [Desulfobulbaceae bacterium]
MQTTLDCLTCFLKQAIHTARLSNASPAVQKEIMNGVIKKIMPSIDFTITPPENAVHLYKLIAEISGCPDPFAAVKKESNRFAASIAPLIRQKVNAADNPLLAALTFSIAGNIIDYGSLHQFDMEQTIYEALFHHMPINDFAELETDLQQAGTILYLGDNSGEIVFDGIAIEKLNSDVTFAVKKKAIINDALLEDARECGLENICRVTTNGTGCPGTPLPYCSAEFRELFHDADLIISKGQGNFETLSEVKAPIYFLLTVKCPVVNDHLFQLTGSPAGWPAKLPFPILLKSPHYAKNKR